MQKRPYKFYSTCVGWPEDDVHAEGGLCSMVDDARDITRRTFQLHVDSEQLREIETALGYDKNLRMHKDWHVSYHRSRLHGKQVYFFKHSAIEHVFTKE